MEKTILKLEDVAKSKIEKDLIAFMIRRNYVETLLEDGELLFKDKNGQVFCLNEFLSGTTTWSDWRELQFRIDENEFLWKQTLEERFNELRKKWWDETSVISDMSIIIYNINHLKIVGLGPSVIPLIFKLLRGEEHNNWFYSVTLTWITGQDPTNPPEKIGGFVAYDSAGIVKCWLDWADKNGY